MVPGKAEGVRARKGEVSVLVILEEVYPELAEGKNLRVGWQLTTGYRDVAS